MRELRALAVWSMVAVVGCAAEDFVDQRGKSGGQRGNVSPGPQSSSSVPQKLPEGSSGEGPQSGWGSQAGASPNKGSPGSGPLNRSSVAPKNGGLALLVMGGYTSCSGDQEIDARDQAMTPMVEYLKKAVKKDPGQEQRILMSCYDADPTRIYYAWEHEKKTQEIRSIDQWVDAIRAQLTPHNAGETMRVGIIGHSYGGWTAMQVASKLAASPQGGVKIAGLVTLDPISRVDCTPAGFIAAAISGQTQPGCRRAPTDMGSDALDPVKKSTRWVNYYQTSVDVLHSGPMAGIENKRKSYEGDGLDAHIEFINDESVYKEITSLLSP